MKNPVISKFIKNILYNLPFKKWRFFEYPFMFNPAQLAFLVDSLDKTKDVNGDILEIGCANGYTAVYLNRHLNFLKSNKNYIAIDTFSGFTKDDISFEQENRNKKEFKYDAFQVNSKKWVEATLKENGVERVTLYETDIQKFDFNKIDSISFCLLDVDVYLPTKFALDKIWERLSSGGIIVVDDCKKNNAWDGSLEAYNEFVKKHNLSANIVSGKLGVIIKPK